MTAPLLRIAAFADRRPKLFALLLGAVSATGFAPLGLWPLTLLALAGWMTLVTRSAKGRHAFSVGWAFGVGHFTIGLNWIATAFTYQAAMPAWLGWIAVLLLALYLAVYPALAAWGTWMVARFRGGTGTAISLSSILAFAALWTLTEWLRSWVFTGFAWNPLSAILTPNMILLSPARFVGSYGMSAVVMLIASFILVQAIRWVPAWWQALGSSLREGTFPTVILGGGLAAIFILSVPFFYMAQVGILTGSPGDDAAQAARKSVPITVVQPNVGQQDKWEGSKADANFAKLARLTAPQDDTPRLILWPEAAVPDYLETGYPSVYYDRSPAEARGRITSLMNSGDVMLLGALKLELDRTGEVVGARNAVMTIHADGTLGPRYDKSHLVPYGEYLPMRPILSAIGLSRLAPGDIDFWPGPGPRTLSLPAVTRSYYPETVRHRLRHAPPSVMPPPSIETLRPAIKIGLQICYEIIFSGQVVDRAHRPDFIFNPSNDAWFGAWGPPQHLAQARLRAIEEGLPVVRATPTGISAVIDANGRILESLPMHAAGRIDTTVPRAHAPTPFARFGNMLPVAFGLLLLALAIAFRRRGR
ncbi:apolipoprotein N-acyltransferase [Sphingopyxis sp. H115]|uniref:apolipoprotein N-acyltransferase n=1 Tax=Sphingopyxis sp. H115 TaxID=1759073 RepID=UPI00073723C5|nr:apolipoprotein N-acyltransferase [Sphingopyxis sp. H115]KTE06585.1 apolipoprotein N-acyltransferase [Sphingopyxis sp. H115]